jgi:LacI family transcriptional regulator
MRTVSEILNEKGKPYKAATVERVFAMAARMGYRPNAQARAVAHGKVGTVALVLGSERFSHIPQHLLHGIHDALAAADLKLMVTVLDDDRLADEAFIPDILQSLVVDGLLVNYHYHFPPHLQDAIDRYRIPAVWINVHKDQDGAYFDEAAAASSAVRRLVDLGHRRIAYLDRALENEESLHYSSIDRRDAYLAAMAQAGLSPLLLTGASARTQELVTGWIGDPERPTAFIGYNEQNTQDVATVAERLGLVIPRDLSLITFADPHSGITPMATYSQDWRPLGRSAGELLLRRMQTDEPLASVVHPLRESGLERLQAPSI